MKSILLTSTALIALGGAAFAEAHETSSVSWGADGEFGYNEEVENGFYFDGGLAVTTNAGMNMGLTAGIAMDVDLNFAPQTEDHEIYAFSGINIGASDFVIFVEGQGAALYLGDTETAAATRWAGTTNMESDGFLEVDDVDNGTDAGDFVNGVIRGDMEYGPVAASLSYLMVDDGAGVNALEGLSLGAEASLGNFVVGMAYQEEVTRNIVGNGPIDEIIGVSAGSTFAGASVKVAYASNQTADENSLGVQVDYPFGPVTATAFYSAESADGVDDNYGVAVAYADGPVAASAYYHDGNDQEIGVEGSYALDGGLTVYAGYIQNDGDSDATEAYVAATYDLGGGASLIGSYGDVGDTYTGANDEIGNSFEVNEGTTVAVSFTF